jgi:putative solute:sodium symporter small subunit
MDTLLSLLKLLRASGRPEAALRGEGVALGARERRHWRRNRRLTGLLILVWFLATFGVAWFARDLNFSFFGWPFAFWIGGQGALAVYLLVVFVYARVMDELDLEHGVAEDR